MASVPPEQESARPGTAGATGLQVGDALLDAALDTCERIMAPQHFAVVLDIHARRVQRRRERYARWLARLGLEEAA
jgi:hypothetical protein